MIKNTVSRKVINLIVTLMLAAGLFIFFSSTYLAEAESVTASSYADGTPGTWQYTLSGSNATKVYCTTTTLTGAVTVPSALDGYPVVSVGGGTLSTGVVYDSKTAVTAVTLPAGVTKIESYAFRGCAVLAAVNIPGGVTSIGNNAFENCTALAEVTIPDSVTTIGSSAFNSCDALITFTIPDSVTSIGTHAFAFCSGLQSITISTGVTQISANAFTTCGALTSITIPDSVTKIENYAFHLCGSLPSITIPNSVTSIGSSAFQTCEALTSITIPKSVITIGANAFKNSGLTNETILPELGYTVQYNTAAGGSGTVVTDLVAAAATTYLSWTPNTYTVTFDPEGGTVSPGTQSVTYDSPYGALPTPDKTGFTFGGWWTGDNGTGTQVLADTFVKITEAQTLYAKWDINSYTVTFNSNDGSAVASQNVNYNSTATAPAAPTKTGYTFGGWYSDSDLATAFNFATPITADITLYAKWTPKTPVSIAEAPQSAIYDGAIKAFSISGSPNEDFTVTYKQGSDVVNPVNAGTYDVVLTRAEDATYAAYGKTIPGGLVINPAAISLQNIGGIIPPSTGTAPVAAAAETAQYTGTVAWSPLDSPFAAETVYTATITLTPKANFALTGVGENSFTVAGATSVTNAADSGVITAVFPATLVLPVTVTSISVSPESVAVQKGNTQTFTATVNGTNSPSQTVTWSVGSSNPGTSIDSSGLLTVAFGETASTLTVTATSTVDNTKSGTATVTVTAAFTRTSGGGTPSTPSTPEYKADVDAGNGSDTTLPVTVDKNNGHASVDVGTGSDLMSGGKTTVVTVPSVPGVDTYTLDVPVPDLTTPDVQGKIAFKTDNGSVTVPSNMLTGVSGISGNKAQISIGQGDKSTLPDDVKAAIGDKPLISLTLSIDGQQTNWSNPGAPVTVSIPYTPTAEELANPAGITVWYIDGSGNAVEVPGARYDPETKTVVFPTTHFSLFAVVYNPDAPAAQKVIRLTIGSNAAEINGGAYTLDAAPYVDIAANRTLVPLRFISGALGAQVTWLANKKQVVIKDGADEIILTTGSRIVLINGAAQETDCASATMPPGRVFVPLRFIAEDLGATVDFDPATRLITLNR